MAVMSFAHLKKGNVPKGVPPAPPKAPMRPQVQSRSAGGVMSFSHLKKKSLAKNVEAKKESEPVKARTTFRIPAVMPTAKLVATNYCRGCPRFLPAQGQEKEAGVYGRCLREGEIDSEIGEVWKKIPAKAVVSRCYFFLNG